MLWLMMAQPAPDLSDMAQREVARTECASSEGDEIIICGKKTSPYRLPGYRERPFDPINGNQYSVMRERARWAEHGDTGIGSCSAVGPGGFTGCMTRKWKQERDQTQWGKNVPRPY